MVIKLRSLFRKKESEKERKKERKKEIEKGAD